MDTTERIQALWKAFAVEEATDDGAFREAVEALAQRLTAELRNGGSPAVLEGIRARLISPCRAHNFRIAAFDALVRGGLGEERPAVERSKADRAVAYLSALVQTWFVTPDGDGYIDIRRIPDGPRETYRTRSRDARALLDALMWSHEETALGGQARQDAIEAIDARATHSGVQHEVHVRTAEADGCVYIDLADSTWRMVAVSVEGWTVVPSAIVPVRFRRPRGVRPLPEPVSGGDISTLQDFVRATGDPFILLVSWLLCALRARGPYPILDIQGEHGSAKTTCGKLIRTTIDPHDTLLRSPPHDDRDLMVSAVAQHVYGIDNISRIADWLSDALCRLATGGGYATRQLYSDDELVILTATRPIVWTAIESVATREDLADRTWPIALQFIPESERRTEAEILAAFAEAAPTILGALLDIVVDGLGRLPTLEVTRLPRMADAARWVLACEPSCPWEQGEFLAALGRATHETARLGIEGDAFASAIVRLLDASAAPWTGTHGELLEALNRRRGEGKSPPKGWPRNARALSGRLTRAQPNLRKIGIEIGRDREAGTGSRRVTLSRRTEDSDE